MSYHLEIEVPGLPPLNPASVAGWHWQKRRRIRTEFERSIHFATVGKRPARPLEKATVRLTRCSHGTHPDPDNLAFSMKFILDGLVKAGILRDDEPACIGLPDFRWETARPNEGCVRVEVWEGNEEAS